MIVRTTSVADQDVVAAAVWFEKQQAGLGNRFLDELESVFSSLSKMPEACPTFYFPGVSFKHNLRWVAVGRFSYLVIFHITGEEVHIMGVLHAHRDLEQILHQRVGVL